MSSEQIRRLNEEPDGAITNFTTPDLFASGSFRLIRNGQVYEPDDPTFGWTELDNQTVQLNEAPEAGEVVQAFYTVLRSDGSFQDPAGSLP